MAAWIRSLSVLAGSMALVSGATWAQPVSTGPASSYPSKPVRVLIGFAAGGSTDIVGRLVFQKMGEQLNQQFPIDNRTGASGMIAAALAAKSPPDGYTILVYSQTMLANAHLYQKQPYDALKDFIGITTLTRIVGMLAVHPSMPVDKLNAEFRKALADADVAAKLLAQTVEPMHMTPEEFARQLKFDYDRLKEVVKVSGARIE